MLDRLAAGAHLNGVMSQSAGFSERVRLQADRIVESRAAALSGLYDLTAQRLVRYAVTVTRNQHDAEDAVQAALVKVASAPERLAKAREPWFYLLRIVRNQSLVILRRKKRWSFAGNLSDLRTRRLVDEVDVEETHRAVWSALRSIPTEQSEVVVLKIWEELTFAQIAELLDVSPATAASRYRYAIEKLTLKLREVDPCEVRDA